MDVIETAPFVLDIGLVLLLAAGCGWLARKVGLPAVVGYLFVGLLVSPFTPGYTADSQQLTVLADIGVVLLLFEVGIEVDLRRVRHQHGALLWLAPVQVLLTTLLAGAVLLWLGISPLGAALLGIGVAMSSSVVVVNITRSRRRTTDPATDDALLSWSVLQDVAGVALAAVVLAVFGAGDHNVVISLGSLVAFGLLAYVAARFLPRILAHVRWENDLFLIISVATGLTLAALGTVIFGIPMALAAFVAGLAINGEQDGHHVRRVLLPFRDLFAVLFFVVIGSLIRPDQIPAALPIAGVLVALLIVFKSLPVAAVARGFKLKARPRQLSIGLSQMGEFAYVLGAIAIAHEALSEETFVAILLVVVASIVASTVLVRFAAPRKQASI